MNNLLDYVKVYDDLLDIDTCNKLINTFEKNQELHERYESNKTPQFTQLNLTSHQLKVGQQLHQTLIQQSVAGLFKYRNELDITKEFPEEYSFEQFRMKRYSHLQEDEFREHVDVHDYLSAKRFLVFFFYLNDVENGGETYFPKLNFHVTPKAGRCLIFPPLWLFPHCGMMASGTDKYIVGSYLHYR